MEFIIVKQRKATLEQQMQLYEIIKGERGLLKANQDKRCQILGLEKKKNDLKIKLQLCNETRRVSNDKWVKMKSKEL